MWRSVRPEIPFERRSPARWRALPTLCRGFARQRFVRSEQTQKQNFRASQELSNGIITCYILKEFFRVFSTGKRLISFIFPTKPNFCINLNISQLSGFISESVPIRPVTKRSSRRALNFWRRNLIEKMADFTPQLTIWIRKWAHYLPN